jgi:hypothetical protein
LHLSFSSDFGKERSNCRNSSSFRGRRILSLCRSYKLEFLETRDRSQKTRKMRRGRLCVCCASVEFPQTPLSPSGRGAEINASAKRNSKRFHKFFLIFFSEYRSFSTCVIRRVSCLVGMQECRGWSVNNELFEPDMWSADEIEPLLVFGWNLG